MDDKTQSDLAYILKNIATKDDIKQIFAALDRLGAVINNCRKDYAWELKEWKRRIGRKQLWQLRQKSLLLMRQENTP